LRISEIADIRNCGFSSEVSHPDKNNVILFLYDKFYHVWRKERAVFKLEMAEFLLNRLPCRTPLMQLK
jgi:hypothetical protein